ncbi:type II restriction/modification system DNA methylase subunit YeeA [Tibeticola sediminis]|uniref:site-specific DNA-methyltransferase (adenine-specific) n=1 Tax=Tibeticola sediminis TaxID=1917811 RepID=A0A3N4URR4_9BURK|nr:DNA methyltransferase [Tibeticola sediminis]RPE72728.1 type II restriction/modification system DNA methylase subunit YeeA [Tibeticola sediminis]
MPLSWNEIKARALAFSREWADARDEASEAKPFWIAFFEIFGISNKRVATFEHAVKKFGGGQGYVDLFWPGLLLVEQKSRGKDLDRAYTQALDYFPGIKERDLPRYVVVSDFARFRLHDLETGQTHEFALAELHKHIRHFGFIAGYEAQPLAPQSAVNIEAAERMGRLHDALKASGYEGHALEVLLVRLLFCLFADDTGIFQPAQALRSYIEERTREDGSDLGPLLARLFQVLNTPEAQRSTALDEQLAAFPYVNGELFAEPIPIADFDAAMREALLDACALDWSAISPAIFGALFQSIMDKTARRNLGAHYTSEENIAKLIKPLFLDALWAEFDKAKKNRNKLFDFHKKLRSLTFFDPACGCGNFLVIAYRELRRLELEVLRASALLASQTGHVDVGPLIAVDVDQFHGIEIEEFPAQIAQVALWLTDHQMNLHVSEEFGQYFARIPLRSRPHIVHGNALTLDWAEVLPPERCSYVLGNPPFVGAKFMNDAQRADAAAVFHGVANAGLLDYVAAWYVKATRYLHAARDAGVNPPQAAFVSTNSITQGEQVGVLWGWLLAQGVHIHFAHRTFAWNNEARGKAAVHCVIIGFGLDDRPDKTIFEYADIKGEPHAVKAANINPYLVDAPDVVLENRSTPLCPVPEIGIGNKPIDGGHYLFTDDEKAEFLRREPQAEQWFHRWLGADEFINGYQRWCLWLGDCPPDVLRRMPEAMKRVEAVRQFRLASKSAPTRKLAQTPTRFHVENMPTSTYLLIPRVSSERRNYIPIGFIPPDTFTSDSALISQAATLYHFGILTSAMHMAWMRAVCGRLESRYRYSAGIVYNNFPWPFCEPKAEDASVKRWTDAIEKEAQAVLEARARFPDATLADLYDPLTMPPELLKAHQRLDAAVDAAYAAAAGGKKRYASDAERVAFLFGLYQRLDTALAPTLPAKPARRPSKKIV